MPPNKIVPLNVPDVSLAQAGGKGRSLSRLASAHLLVPPGFILSTDTYLEFVEVNNLQAAILEIVARVAGQPLLVDEAETNIRTLFSTAKIPTATAEAIRQAYGELKGGGRAVAVRSSATAEDLPGMSFAGQQDTYLNVCGESALLEAVRNCWASLWTARAISYREKMRIDHGDIAMAVVVQIMVQAEVAGVLFTANPVSGNREEIVINASYGLGEAIVSGRVTPDTYTVERSSLEIKQSLTSDKQQMIVSLPDQGTRVEDVPENKRGESSLAEDLQINLARLSIKVEQLFDGVPQDIEWAVVDGDCYLLQSRPITNLPAAPLSDVQWKPPQEGTKLIRRQVVENMPEPLSPLFEELYLQDGLDQSLDQVLSLFDMPFKIEDFIERPMFLTVNGYAYCRASYNTGWRMLLTIPKILYWYVTNLKKLIRNLIPLWKEEGLPTYLAVVDHWKSVDLSSATDEELLTGIRALTVADAIYWFYLSFVMGAAKVTDGLLHYLLTSRAVRGELTSGMFLRGFPSKTMEAQLELEAIATRINKNDELRELVKQSSAANLLESLGRHAVSDAILQDVQQYLDRYGHQIYNLDFVQPTQVEDPLPVFLSLKSLVQNADYDTVLRQAEMTRERESLIKNTLDSLGPIRRWLFRKFLRWAQGFGPNREEALFYMGAGWPTLRGLALELGSRLTEVGTINDPDDVFYLKTDELIASYTARTESRKVAKMGLLAKSRRELRESRKRLHPPPMVPEKSRFKIGPFDMSAWETQKRNKEDSAILNGFAVSPGNVTGIASVILSPADFEKMQPNTILVCATTTPAWTPLFAQALGLVTDIGGMLAHGSIVAREYGIPAVMGTGNITQRIVSGQKIMVNGDAGTVTILD